MKKHVCLALAAALALTGCGESKQDRALGGAAVGAGAGLAVGAMVGAPGTGAVWGAAVGAATGALTDAEQINLGKPWWK
jgi:hypothetical protein